MSNIAIKVESLSKLYKIGTRRQGYKTLRESVMGTLTAPFRRLAHRAKRKANPAKRSAPGALRSSSDAMLRAPYSMPSSSDDTIWALKDVSFEVKQGEVVGIIGSNGAGKTTLLKILSRITEPTEGRAEIYGRVGSLLEVGTGFHPELTGRENIYLNGAILGMRKAEIERKFDEMVDFAEIEKFIDTPIKRYSSGMYVRLAFAVAAHLEPEVLVVDEVLAVGDAAFQKKCLGKMGDVAKEGRTVLFVSHNMRAITDLCQCTIWIDGGRIRDKGVSQLVVTDYLSCGTSATGCWVRPGSHPSAGELELKSAHVSHMGGHPVPTVHSGEPFDIAIEYEIKSRLHNCSVVLRLTDMNGTVVLTSWDSDSNDNSLRVRELGTYRSICRVPAHLLKPGRYTVTLAAHIYRIKVLDCHENVLSFDISDIGFKFNTERPGVVQPILGWTTRKA